MRPIPRARRGRDEQGLALVEFALVAPLLFVIVFGMIEFGWGFTQTLDIRHGAREAARLAAVDYQALPGTSGAIQAEDLIEEVCDRMDGQAGATVTLAMPGGSDAGQRVEVTIAKAFEPLTGFLDFAVGGITLSSTVESRLEQEATWAPMTGTCT